jgi:hypothetical protein
MKSASMRPKIAPYSQKTSPKSAFKELLILILAAHQTQIP